MLHCRIPLYAADLNTFFLDIFDPSFNGCRNVNIKPKGADMETLVGILAFGTLGFAVAFGYLSVRSMEKLRDSDEPKSALSRDGIEDRLRAAAQQ
ncbi:MAG: hypothetical protein AAFN80_03120 [Pseudomonadota bacterium]